MAEEIYSPGLEGIVAGETAICTLAGGLSYRGYSIEELADKCDFEEVAHLLLHGELPTLEQRTAFCERIANAMTLPPELLATLASLPTTAPMMDLMRSVASLLAHWDSEVADNSAEANLRKAERLLAKMPVALAAAYRLRRGWSPIAARPNLSFAANFLWMLHGKEAAAHHVRALDMTLIMYAEHEFNASTFTARVVVSTLSDLHSAISAAIGALKGPLHGGANERVMEVLQDVGSPERAETWIREALAKKVRVMGFGHRVYKHGDVRAKYLKPLCVTLARETGNDSMEQTAEVIEQHIVREKGLLPNLDWPSARIYHYLGLPVELYTPLFVLSRVTGWSSHVIEQLANNRLIRPRSRYVGPESKTWRPISERSK